jgi:hypothetical protein
MRRGPTDRTVDEAVAVYEDLRDNGPATLAEAADRMGLSPAIWHQRFNLLVSVWLTQNTPHEALTPANTLDPDYQYLVTDDVGIVHRYLRHFVRCEAGILRKMKLVEANAVAAVGAIPLAKERLMDDVTEDAASQH